MKTYDEQAKRKIEKKFKLTNIMLFSGIILLVFVFTLFNFMLLDKFDTNYTDETVSNYSILNTTIDKKDIIGLSDVENKFDINVNLYDFSSTPVNAYYVTLYESRGELEIKVTPKNDFYGKNISLKLKIEFDGSYSHDPIYETVPLSSDGSASYKKTYRATELIPERNLGIKNVYIVGVR